MVDRHKLIIKKGYTMLQKLRGKQMTDPKPNLSDWGYGTRKSKKYVPKDKMKQSIVDYIGERVKPVSIAMLQNRFDYANPQRVHQLMNELMEENKVVRVGRGVYVSGTEDVPEDTMQAIKEYSMSPGRKRVFDYVVRHQGEFISLNDISSALGVTGTAVFYQLRALVNDGMLEKSVPTAQGTRYRVPGNTAIPDSQESPVAPEEPVEEADEPVVQTNKNEDTFITMYRDLMIEFMIQTRSTDTLMFLTWLEQRKG